MLTTRLAVFFLATVLFLADASAQLVHTSIVAHSHGSNSVLPSSVQALSSLPFAVFQLGSDTVQVNSANQYTFDCTVRNLSSSPDTIYFSRAQALPPGWSSSVCWGTTCYPETDSSESYIIPALGKAGLSLNVFPCLNNVADSTTILLKIGSVGSTTDTMLLPFSVTFVPMDPPLVFQWSGLASPSPTFDTVFSGKGQHVLANFLSNEYSLGADYFFTIQDSLPAGWSLSTCVRSNTGTSCADGDTLSVMFSEYTGSTYNQEIKFTVDDSQAISTDSAIIYLGVHPRISNPADSQTYRFSIVVEPDAGVTLQPDGSAGLVVTNEWPNPVHPSSILHLELLTDRAGPISAEIYDLNGTLEGTLDLGSLSVGSNDVQSTIPDIPSGEYIIRLQQGADKPQVVRVSYIK